MKYLITSLILMSNMAFAANSIYIDQIGNDNTIYIQQQAATEKSISIVSNGDSNNFSIYQYGFGNHIVDIQSNSSGNNALITQFGSATKQLNLQLQGNQIGITVIQDNPNTPDSAILTIQCLTPPCNGYSYIKH